MDVAVLTSGGVDSSVSLRLLEEQDHRVTAFYLKIWLEDELSHLGFCPWKEDLDYIREICREINVELEVLSMQRAYFDRVVQYAIDEVRVGRTPNPDIFCNNRIKFGLFLDQITGFDAVASGHYAQTIVVNGKTHLKQAPDPVKDQTYFLATLPEHKLNNIIFPIGHLNKAEVRQLAAAFALPNKNRKDSQGICFLGKFKYRDFLNHYLGKKPGKFIEYETRNIVGQHDGYWYYTPGQRQGIGLSGGPWFVVSKNIHENTVFISRAYYNNHLQRKAFKAINCAWFAENPPVKTSLRVKLRHGPYFHDCTIKVESEQTLSVVLSSSDQGIAEGQFAVFYDEDVCLGAGQIINLD